MKSKVTGKKIGCVGHDCAECKRKASEARKQLRATKGLSDAVLLFIYWADKIMLDDRKEASGKLALLVNSLEMTNDSVRYTYLGVDFRSDNKEIAAKKIINKQVQP